MAALSCRARASAVGMHLVMNMIIQHANVATSTETTMHLSLRQVTTNLKSSVAKRGDKRRTSRLNKRELLVILTELVLREELSNPNLIITH